MAAPLFTLNSYQVQTLAALRRFLEKKSRWSLADEEAAGQQAESEVQSAITEAEKAAPPALETLFEDVYATAPAYLREQGKLAARVGAGKRLGD